MFDPTDPMDQAADLIDEILMCCGTEPIVDGIIEPQVSVNWIREAQEFMDEYDES